MRPSVVTALAFLGGAAMAQIPTQGTTAISEAPDETVERSGGRVAAEANTARATDHWRSAVNCNVPQWPQEERPVESPGQQALNRGDGTTRRARAKS